jgi:hypothetical protein
MMRCGLEKQKSQENITNFSAHFLRSDEVRPFDSRSQIAAAPLKFLPDDAEE